MPFGSGPLIREALVRATPWQRYVICLLMVIAGILLVIEGHASGALLTVTGVGILERMLRQRRRSHDEPRGAGGGG